MKLTISLAKQISVQRKKARNKIEKVLVSCSRDGDSVTMTLDSNRVKTMVEGVRLFHCTRSGQFDHFRVSDAAQLAYTPVLGTGIYLTGSRGVVRMYRGYLKRSESRTMEVALTPDARIYPLTEKEYKSFRSAARMKLDQYGKALRDALIAGKWDGVCFSIEHGAIYEMAVFNPHKLRIVSQDISTEEIPLLQAV